MSRFIFAGIRADKKEALSALERATGKLELAKAQATLLTALNTMVMSFVLDKTDTASEAREHGAG